MNKRLFLTSALVGSTLVFAGCKQLSTSGTPAPTATPSEPKEMSATKIKEIADATKAGQPIKCTSVDKKTGYRSETVISPTDFKLTLRAESANNKVSRVISDGKVMYNWDESTKKGTKLTLTDTAEMKKSVDEMTKKFEADPNFTDPEKIKERQAESSTITDCDVTTLNPADFIPPSDVEFEDMTAMMQKGMDALKKSQDSMTDDQKKQMEDALKKYGGQ